jgi:cardiolipin synthase (CMP-forming)
MFKEILLIPNILSIIRILLLFPTSYLLINQTQEKTILIIVLMLAMLLTDLLDGFLARKLNQVSELGKIIDPIADKISVITIAVILLFQDRLPIWFVCIIILRDVLILVFGLYLKRKINITLMSNYPGKIAVLVLGIILLISVINNNNNELLYNISSLLISISLLLIIYSSVIYFIRFKNKIGEKNYGSS